MARPGPRRQRGERAGRVEAFCGLGFRVEALGFRGLGFRVEALGFRV